MHASDGEIGQCYLCLGVVVLQHRAETKLPLALALASPGFALGGGGWMRRRLDLELDHHVGGDVLGLERVSQGGVLQLVPGSGVPVRGVAGRTSSQCVACVAAAARAV